MPIQIVASYIPFTDPSIWPEEWEDSGHLQLVFNDLEMEVQAPGCWAKVPRLAMPSYLLSIATRTASLMLPMPTSRTFASGKMATAMLSPMPVCMLARKAGERFGVRSSER